MPNLLNLASQIRSLVPMSAAERRVTAYHEAGHAVIHALAGRTVKWVCIHDDSRYAGECNTVQMQFPVWWRDDWQGYSYSPETWQGWLSKREDPDALQQIRRGIICGTVAGKVAEHILAHGPVTDDSVIYMPEPVIRELDDLLLARAMAILDGDDGSDHDRLCEDTFAAMSEPAIWALVAALAEALIVSGRIEGEALAKYLPEARQGWPSMSA